MRDKRDFATYDCAFCGAIFNKENPCWNDAGCFDQPDGSVIHVDGECKKCAAIRNSVHASDCPIYVGEYCNCVVGENRRRRVEDYNIV